MTADELQTLIEDATADYALGETDSALAKLARATAAAPTSFEAWHALAEVNFSLRYLDAALAAADRAHALQPADLFINTTLFLGGLHQELYVLVRGLLERTHQEEVHALLSQVVSVEPVQEAVYRKACFLSRSRSAWRLCTRR